MPSGTAALRVALLTILAFLSGCCALAYEVLYLRAVTTLLGDGLQVHAALLSTFLVGIGMGARLAHRGMRWLWAFEVSTGLYALLFPATAKWFSELPVMIPVTGSAALTALATIGFLLLPSLLIGFSIPLFSAYIKAVARERLAFQGVYAAYNLGAFASVLVVELILVRQLGIRSSLALVGGVNLANGVVLLAMRGAPARASEAVARRLAPRLLAALAIVSVASAVFQVFFLKLSYLLFAPHRENFAISLSIALLGIFLGARLASSTRIRFETCMLLLPIAIGAVFASFAPLVRLHLLTAPGPQHSELQLLFHKVAIGCVFALGPMILFGATLPALMRSEREVAHESGQLLFVASLANAAGYLAYVFVGHPLLPTQGLLALLCGAALLAGLLASGFHWSRFQGAVAAVGVGLTVLLVARWREEEFYLAQWIDRLPAEREVLTVKSGSDNVTVVRDPTREWISYNGNASITPRIGSSPEFGESLTGVIPALAAPRLERALVIGLGAGLTAGATALLFQSTDVVEISGAFHELMPHFSYASFSLDANPNATLHLADGRSFLLGKERRYDAIINAVTPPAYYAASKVYTLEFYERVKRALTPDGVFATWLATDMSDQGILLVLSGLRRAFRYCDLYLMRFGYYTTTCSDQPLRPRRFSELPAEARLRAVLRPAFRAYDPDELFEDIRISNNLFERFTPVVPRENTDDHPVLEFAAVRRARQGTGGDEIFLEEQELLNIDPVRLDGSGDRERQFRRSALFLRLDRRFYERNFAPLIEQGVIAGP